MPVFLMHPQRSTIITGQRSTTICTEEEIYEQERIFKQNSHAGGNGSVSCIFVPSAVVQGELDWRLLMLLVGIPFGIRKMFLWVVPSGMGIGGTVGVAAFNLMAGGVIGSVIMVWRLLVAVFTMIKGVAVGICRITGIGR